jgi:CDP-diacylglycerol--glycerol-3-phosphate 3-phosphatidyltransferase
VGVNVPNQITLGRLGLAIVFFVLLSLFSAERLEESRWLLAAAFWVFLLAAVTDVIDGLLARAWRQETSFGRVLDPVVDKVIVCGAFLFLASDHFFDRARGVNISGVQPWMVVVILLRELLVSALRMHSESRGQSFAASWAGKLKMFIQSVTICVLLGHLAWYEQLRPLAQVFVWITVIATLLSIAAYLHRARLLLADGFSAAGAAAGDGSAAAPREQPGAAEVHRGGAVTVSAPAGRAGARTPAPPGGAGAAEGLPA